jgi:selenide,water dikinase
VLAPLAEYAHPDLLVGLKPADDAAIYRLRPDLAVVQTLDFFPPVVDDPYAYGAIAAANSMSDVFAKGGRVLLALNIAGFPEDFPHEVVTKIFQGGADKVAEAGGIVAGGHTVIDKEPKYGLSVSGFVEDDRVVRNTGARIGDALVLTKPLGFGILTTALKRDLVSEFEIEEAVEEAATLNKGGCAALREVEVSAATDVTGYGFLGHLSEMLEASGVGAVVRRGEVPVWERAVTLAADGCYPGGLKNNREYLGDRVRTDGVDPDELLALYDPQTSGGLLVAVPGERASAFVHALERHGASGAIVGEVIESQTIVVTL